MLDACALLPPMEPATAEPIRFLATFSSTIASTVVLSTVRTTSPGSVASTHTLLPRPSTQFMADGFLSTQTLPERASSCARGKRSSTTDMAASTPLLIMFMPIASPVVHRNRRNALRPATCVSSRCRRPKREVPSNAALICANASASSVHALSSAASTAPGSRTTGARVIPSAMSADRAPPLLAMARAPRLVDATSAPSVVASGTVNSSPSSISGPTTPTGSGT
mmetsp:Transcript_3369/g.10589  ORF Transcript_3369/g.10589 Transcript_3369/m.10589 type:complete len:224 (+) Transcript_3369:562-1233(+)